MSLTNTPTSPLRIDFREAVSIQTLTDILTPEQQAALQAYLTTRFNLDQRSVVYIAGDELRELQAALDSGSSLDPFFDTQVAEGFSLSDMLPAGQEVFTNLDEIEVYAHEILFGASGLFRDMPLSTNAREHFAAWFSLTILERFANGTMDVTAFRNETGEFVVPTDPTRLFGENISVLQNTTETPGEELISIAFAQQWEENAVIMDPLRGKDFFTQVLSWEIATNQVSATLAEANNTNGEIVVASVEGIQQFLQEQMGSINASFHEAWGIQEHPAPTQTNTETIENGDWFTRFTEAIAQLFAVFWNILSNIINAFTNAFDRWIGLQETNQATPPTTTQPDEVDVENPEENGVLLLSSLQSLNPDALTPIRQAELLSTLSHTETRDRVLILVNNIYSDKNTQETISHLFVWTPPLFSIIITDLQSHGFPILQATEGHTSLEIFTAILSEYWRYQQSDEGTNWEEYIQIRQANWYT